MPARLRGGDPEPVQQISRVSWLVRRLVRMKAAKMRREDVQRVIIDVGNDRDGPPARPARDDEPGGSHPATP